MERRIGGCHHDKSCDPIVVVDGLFKQYGKVKAVNNLSFIVYPGETFGLLGPNGAAKPLRSALYQALFVPIMEM